MGACHSSWELTFFKSFEVLSLQQNPTYTKPSLEVWSGSATLLVLPLVSIYLSSTKRQISVLG